MENAEVYSGETCERQSVGHRHMLGKKTAFTEEEEAELEEFLLDMARRGFPLTESDIHDLSFQYAKKNSMNVFRDDKQRAGYYWMKGFLSRHPRISVKSPEGLSAARAVGMNKTVIFKWFDSYEDVMNKLDIKELPSHVWNLDESSFRDHFVPKKAVGKKGQPLYQVTGGEKGETVIVLPVFNAVGDFGPVMVIFKGLRLKSDWAVGSHQMPSFPVPKMDISTWSFSWNLVNISNSFCQRKTTLKNMCS